MLNGVLLPFVLIYMVMLINKKGLMKEWTNSAAYNAVAWVSVVIMIGLTLALASITIKQMMPAGGGGCSRVQSLSPSAGFAQMQSHDPGRHSLKANVRESRVAHLIRQTIGIGKFAD